MDWTSVYERLAGSFTIHPIKSVSSDVPASIKRQRDHVRQIGLMLTITGTQ
jgi:hypothetical protein